MTVYPSGTTQPTASNLNFTPGQSIPNLVTVKVGTRREDQTRPTTPPAPSISSPTSLATTSPAPQPSRGRSSVWPPPGCWIPASATAPRRLPPTSYGTVDLQVTGRGGVPATGVAAVVMNVTVTGPSAGGFMTVYPSGTSQPTASNLNFTPGQSIPNLVTVKVGTGGKIKLTNNSAGTIHLIADVAGYYLAG